MTFFLPSPSSLLKLPLNPIKTTTNTVNETRRKFYFKIKTALFLAQRYKPSGVPSFFLYNTFSLDFLKSSFVTFILLSRKAIKPASVQMACWMKIQLLLYINPRETKREDNIFAQKRVSPLSTRLIENPRISFPQRRNTTVC